MPTPIVVRRSLPDTPVYASIQPSHDYVPDDPDYYVVTFVKGAFQRFVVRDIPTLEAAKAQAEEFNREHGKYGRRSLIHAVKGFRSYDASALCRD